MTWSTATKAADRALRIEDFYHVFDEVTTVSISSRALEGLLASVSALQMSGMHSLGTSSTAVSIIGVSRTGPPPPLIGKRIARGSLQLEVADALRNCGVAYVHGTSGTGKTTQAALFAHGDREAFLWVNCRDAEEDQLRSQLDEVGRRVDAEPRYRYVVADEVEGMRHGRPLEELLPGLLYTLRHRNGSLVLTGDRPLSQRLSNVLSLTVGSAIAVGLFTEAEVRLLLREYGATESVLTYRDESLRIVSDELWERCVRRRTPNPTLRLKCGGRPKFLLSGILKCGVCGASYVMKNQRSYGCAGYVEGRNCANGVDIRRDWVETALLMPVYNDVLEPKRVERMAKELQAAYLKCQRSEQSKAAQAPAEMQAIDERIERLRARLRNGDPDLAPDELEAALSKAEEKRRSLLNAPSVTTGARVISMLPSAAADFREQIKHGLAGDAGASLKARVVLRQYFGGQIKMIPDEDGSLYAEYLQHRIALLPGVGTNGGPCTHQIHLVRYCL